MRPFQTHTLLAAGLAAALSTSALAQDRGPLDALPPSGGLPAPTQADAYLGAPDNFGRRLDADGDLLIIADDTTASIYNTATSSFEVGDLLTLPGQPVTGITSVRDVALDGDLAVVFVGRSAAGEQDLLIAFRRMTLLGSVTWTFDAQLNFYADFGIPATDPELAAWFDCHDGRLAVSTSVPSPFFNAPVTALYDTSLPGQLTKLGGTGLGISAAIRSVGAGPAGHIAPGATGYAACQVGNSLPAVVRYYTSSGGAAPVLQSSLDDAQSSSSRFGDAVVVHDNLIVVGEPGADLTGTDSGRVWIYNGFGGFLQTLAPEALVSGDEFGRSLAISPDGLTLAVGERLNDAVPGATNSGYVRLARRATSSAPFVLDGDTLAKFGSVGAPGDDTGVDMAFGTADFLALGSPGDAATAGLVSLFTLPPTPWVQTQQSPALAGTGGLAPRLELQAGIYASGPLVVSVRDAKPDATCFMVAGLVELLAPFKGGVLYTTPDLLLSFPTGPTGSFVLPTLWLESSTLLGPFDVFFQYWIQDAGGPVNFASSDGGVVHQY